MQRFLKFDNVGVFHSYSELLFAALLESDPSVTSFTPQPKGFRLNGKQYIPDCYFIKDGKQFFVELKPEGKFTSQKKRPLEEYVEEFGGEFRVVSNESVLRDQIKAQNWLRIVRVLVANRYEPSAGDDNSWIRIFTRANKVALGDLIDQTIRFTDINSEVTIFRLLHQGILGADLDTKPLSFDTTFFLCD